MTATVWDGQRWKSLSEMGQTELADQVAAKLCDVLGLGRPLARRTESDRAIWREKILPAVLEAVAPMFAARPRRGVVAAEPTKVGLREAGETPMESGGAVGGAGIPPTVGPASTGVSASPSPVSPGPVERVCTLHGKTLCSYCLNRGLPHLENDPDEPPAQPVREQGEAPPVGSDEWYDAMGEAVERNPIGGAYWPAQQPPAVLPLSSCSACGRKTWDPLEVGAVCGMPQPSGTSCTGRFVPPVPAVLPVETPRLCKTCCGFKLVPGPTGNGQPCPTCQQPSPTAGPGPWPCRAASCNGECTGRRQPGCRGPAAAPPPSAGEPAGTDKRECATCGAAWAGFPCRACAEPASAAAPPRKTPGELELALALFRGKTPRQYACEYSSISAKLVCPAVEGGDNHSDVCVLMTKMAEELMERAERIDESVSRLITADRGAK